MLIITTSLLNIAHNHWIPCIALRKSIKFLLSIPSSGHSSHGWCAGLQTQSARGPGFYKSDSFLTMILAHVVWRCVLMIIIWYFNCDGEWRWYWYCDDTLTATQTLRLSWLGKKRLPWSSRTTWTLNYDNAGWVKNALTFVYEEERCIQSSAIMKNKNVTTHHWPWCSIIRV